MTGVFETQTLRVCPTEQIICVKEDCFTIPKFSTRTFLNANLLNSTPYYRNYIAGNIKNLYGVPVVISNSLSQQINNSDKDLYY